MTSTATVSPLHAEHRELGAQFTDFAGWQMPLKYDSELAEHNTVRNKAGLFDLSHMGEIIVEGSDAAGVLDYALAGELSKMAVGKAKYSLLCDSAGGVLDDLVVYRTAEHRYLIVANASNTSIVYREISLRAKHFDATVRDHTVDTALLAVQGPAAADVITALAGDAALIDDIKYYSAVPAAVAGMDVLLARTGYTGEDGFELFVPSDEARELWRALLVETRARGGVPAGLACRDTLRLEAGMALYGHELTAAITPYEAGLGRVVQLSKGFVGRDALKDIADRERPRRLVGLTGSGRRAARAGYAVTDTRKEAPIGVITSGALSPTLGYPIALAYVESAFAEPGTHLGVDIRGKTEPFTVTATPFYRRP
jgi:aminomethyltransferase